MPSRKKIAANRANALKSTGPKTQAGKEVSRRNSLVHGLTAQVLLLDHEDPAEFEALRDALLADYPPEGAQDVIGLSHLERLVSVVWRLRRVPAYEQSLIAWTKHRQHVEHDGPIGEMPKPAKGVTALVPKGLGLTKGSQSDVDLQRLRTGRALEALLQCNALGKLDAHQANLHREFKLVFNWLEETRRNRFVVAQQKASAAPIVEHVPASPPQILPPSVPPGGPTTSAAEAKPADVDSLRSRWQEASARGGYISPTEREARKQEAQPKGGSANTAG